MAAPERIDLDGGLVLRRWRPADAEAMSLAIDESLDLLRPWLPWAAAASLEEQRVTLTRWDQEWQRGGDLVYGLFLGALVVGSFGLHRRIGPDGLEIGYWMHAAHTRRGYASAATATLTTVAFTLPGISLVEIHHDRANVASEGVPRKLGFTLIGESPKRPPAAPAESGIWRIWRMTREDWLPLAAPAKPPA
jgi:RimJ/RimL family protein N-acetyltransferase